MRAALRLQCTQPQPAGIADSHHKFGYFLRRLGLPAEALAHHLACALLHHLLGDTHKLSTSLRAVGFDLSQPGQ